MLRILESVKLKGSTILVMSSFQTRGKIVKVPKQTHHPQCSLRTVNIFDYYF